MKWISVKDKLPPADGETEFLTIEIYDYKYASGFNYNIAIFSKINGVNVWQEMNEFLEVEVDYWMPLPLPPEISQ